MDAPVAPAQPIPEAVAPTRQSTAPGRQAPIGVAASQASRHAPMIGDARRTAVTMLAERRSLPLRRPVHASGVEIGAPTRARAQKAAASVFPRAFCM